MASREPYPRPAYPGSTEYAGSSYTKSSFQPAGTSAFYSGHASPSSNTLYGHDRAGPSSYSSTVRPLTRLQPSESSRETGPSGISRKLLVPPRISEQSLSSIARIPLPSDTIARFRRCRIPLDTSDTLLNRVKQLVDLESRSVALKGLRAMRTDSPYQDDDEILFQTLYTASTFVGPADLSTSLASAKGKRKDREEDHPSPLSTQGNASTSSAAAEAEIASQREHLELFVIDMVSKSRQSGAESAERNAAPAGKTDEEVTDSSKPSPADDLWGDSGGSSPAKLTSPPLWEDEVRQLGQQIAAAKAALEEELGRTVSGQTMSVTVGDLFAPTDNATKPSDALAFLVPTLPAAFYKLQSALSDKFGNVYCHRRRLQIERPLTKKDQDDRKPGTDRADQTATAAESDENPEPAAEGADTALVSPKAPSTEPIATLRPAIKTDEGFLLLPRGPLPEDLSARKTSRRRVLQGAWQVSYAPPLPFAPEESKSGSVVASLRIRDSLGHHCMPRVGHDVLTAPRWSRAKILRVETASTPLPESLHTLKDEIATKVALDTCADREDLLRGPWYVLQDSDCAKIEEDGEDANSANAFTWPGLLCFPLSESLSGSETNQPNFCRTMSTLPFGELLDKTAQMLRRDDEQEKTNIPTVQVEQADSEPQEQAKEITLQVKQASESPAEAGDAKATKMERRLSHLSSRASERSRSRTSIDSGNGDPTDDDDDDDLFGSDGEDPESLRADQVEAPEEKSGPASLQAPESLPRLRNEATPRTEAHPTPNRALHTRGEDHEEMYGLITEDDFAFFDDSAEEILQLPNDIRMDFEATDKAVPTKGNCATVVAEEPLAQSPHDQQAVAAADPPSVAYEAAASVADTSGPSTDPSSLPGFTPGSLTDSSPANGGPFDRTPRTPSSPYYDGVVIPGSRLPNAYHPSEDWQDGDSTMVDETASEQKMAAESTDVVLHAVNENGKPLSLDEQHARRLRDLGNKYSSGKFAVPAATAAGIAGGGRRLAAGRLDAQGKLISEQASGPLTLTEILKLRSQARSAEEVSEQGTHDETMSQLSEYGDDDDDSSDNEEDEEAAEQARKDAQEWTTFLTNSLQRTRPPKEATVQQLQANKERDGQRSGTEGDAGGDLRDELARYLISNAPLRKALLETAAPPDSAVSTLPSVDSTDVLSSMPTTMLHARLSQSSGPVEILEDPKVLVSCQGNISQFAPSALQFWDKLGLSAVGGPRNVSAWLLRLPSRSASWIEEVGSYFERFQAMFERMRLGSFNIAGEIALEVEQCNTSEIQGLVGRLSSSKERNVFLQAIASQLSSALGPDRHAVVYIFIDSADYEDMSTALRLQAELRMRAKGEFARHIYVHLVPWATIVKSIWRSTTLLDAEAIRRQALALYEALLVVTERRTLRELHPTLTASSELARLPSFALVSDVTRRGEAGRNLVSFRLNSNYTNPEATTQTLFLHVAYDIGTKPGDLACVSLIDENGHQCQVRTRRRGRVLRSTLEWIWSVVSAFISGSTLRWRVVICKRIPMSIHEICAWYLISIAGAFIKSQCIDVTIACRDTQTPFLADTTLSQEAQRGLQPSKNTLIDAASASFAVYPSCRIPMAALVHDQGFVSDGSTPIPQSFASQVSIMPLQSSVVVTVNRGPQASRIPSACQEAERRGHSSSCGPYSELRHAETSSATDGNHVAWLHILQVHHGRLAAAEASSNPVAGMAPRPGSVQKSASTPAATPAASGPSLTVPSSSAAIPSPAPSATSATAGAGGGINPTSAATPTSGPETPSAATPTATSQIPTTSSTPSTQSATTTNSNIRDLSSLTRQLTRSLHALCLLSVEPNTLNLDGHAYKRCTSKPPPTPWHFAALESLGPGLYGWEDFVRGKAKEEEEEEEEDGKKKERDSGKMDDDRD